MAKVKILSPEVQSKIAAGEVITRPVSVVKELIENSLDAHALRIDIEISDGGKKQCLVNDDGEGMSRQDALRSIERYATSKIDSVDDIEGIVTYGFRGEALASIAQVSHFELETSDGFQGTHIIVHGGELKKTLDSARMHGTRVKVENLFFNLPARFKFMKSSQWERRLISETVRSYAFITPAVSFTIFDNNNMLLQMSGVGHIGERLKIVLPEKIYEALIPIEHKVGRIKITGFLSRPDFFQRHHINYLYVNARPVRYPRIYRTIMQAYQGPKAVPAFIINIEIDPSMVDVNIHPTKSEVKFKEERYICDLLTQVLKKKIFSKQFTTTYKPVTEPLEKLKAEQSAQFIQDMIISDAASKTYEKSRHEHTSEFWQIHNMYILAQTSSGFIIVDQHVAHERIIFESIMKGKGGAQRLLFPITLELSAEEYRAYKRTKTVLKELGIEFKEFSARTVVIDSLPADAVVDRSAVEGLFKEIDGLGNLVKEKAEIAKVVACRSAIKAGQKLSITEMQSLIDRLFACANPYICPHGRPIVLKFSLDELASKFGRE